MTRHHTRTQRLRRRFARELLFRIGVWLKGLDGALEILGGAILVGLTPGVLLTLVRLLTQDEIADDPQDLIANFLRQEAARLSLAGQHFMGLYLLAHGLIKVVLVFALLRRVLLAYPVSIAVFAGFILYQLYRYTLAPSVGLIALSAVDLVVIGLIYLEYRALRLHRA